MRCWSNTTRHNITGARQHQRNIQGETVYLPPGTTAITKYVCQAETGAVEATSHNIITTSLVGSVRQPLE